MIHWVLLSTDKTINDAFINICSVFVSPWQDEAVKASGQVSSTACFLVGAKTKQLLPATFKLFYQLNAPKHDQIV